MVVVAAAAAAIVPEQIAEIRYMPPLINYRYRYLPTVIGGTK